MCIWGRSRSPAARRYSRVAAGRYRSRTRSPGPTLRYGRRLRTLPSPLLVLPDCPPRRVLRVRSSFSGARRHLRPSDSRADPSARVDAPPALAVAPRGRTTTADDLVGFTHPPPTLSRTVPSLGNKRGAARRLRRDHRARRDLVSHGYRSRPLGRSYTFSAPYSPLDRLLNLDASIGSKCLLVHAALLSLFIGIGVAYYEFILPYLAPRGLSLPQQALGL